VVKPDVIVAIATGASRSAIGIVRLSGADLGGYLDELLRRRLSARLASYSYFLDSAGEAIDSGLAVFFPAPHSFTGEDVLELQAHGGIAVLQLLLRRCLELGARLARPGEFTERAFLNGKLDLAQAESVADLINAGSEAAARAASRSLRGEFSAHIQGIVAELISLRILIEAHLDFPEEDIEVAEAERVQGRVQALIVRLTALRKTAQSGKLLRDGVVAVLIGRPNVGKSSLLNRLAEEDVAIVTEIPGTTRDPIRSDIVIRGVPVHIIDTAGLRESQDRVEKLGIERTWKAVEEADVVLIVQEARQSFEEESVLPRIPSTKRSIRVLNKIDLCEGLAPSIGAQGHATIVQVSAKTGDGVELLKDAILGAVGWEPEGSATFLARERHLHALQLASGHLVRAEAVHLQPELFAEELRLSQEALGEITGKYTTDDLLGEIFSRFCIGK
jgi:tRNA modification GTPase